MCLSNVILSCYKWILIFHINYCFLMVALCNEATSNPRKLLSDVNKILKIIFKRFHIVGETIKCRKWCNSTFNWNFPRCRVPMHKKCLMKRFRLSEDIMTEKHGKNTKKENLPLFIKTLKSFFNHSQNCNHFVVVFLHKTFI